MVIQYAWQCDFFVMQTLFFFLLSSFLLSINFTRSQSEMFACTKIGFWKQFVLATRTSWVHSLKNIKKKFWWLVVWFFLCFIFFSTSSSFTSLILLCIERECRKCESCVDTFKQTNCILTTVYAYPRLTKATGRETERERSKKKTQ